MATYQVAYKASDGTVKIQPDGVSAGSGFVDIGSFDHFDDPDDELGHNDNHVLFHHVQDLLYTEEGEQNMQRVSITIPVNSISSLPATQTLDLVEGGTQQIQITNTILPAIALNTAVTYSSSDPTKATVDANGLVTAVAVGATTITITAADDGGASDTVVITVVDTTE